MKIPVSLFDSIQACSIDLRELSDGFSQAVVGAVRAACPAALGELALTVDTQRGGFK